MCSRRSSGSNAHSSSSSSSSSSRSSSDLHSIFGSCSSSVSRRTRRDRRLSLEGAKVPGGHFFAAFHQRHTGGRASSGNTGQSGAGAATAFFAPAHVPVSTYCAGIGECAVYRRTWGNGAVRTSFNGSATRRYVWLRLLRRGRLSTSVKSSVKPACRCPGLLI